MGKFLNSLENKTFCNSDMGGGVDWSLYRFVLIV